MQFSEMRYIRPDISDLQREGGELTARLKRASCFEEADGAFRAMEALTGRFATAATLALIRQRIDTNDAFYDAQISLIDEIEPVFEELSQDFDKALIDSPFKPAFEEKYGALMFKNIELSLKAFSPELIPDLQAENALVTEYAKLIASAQIHFDGGVYTLSQLTPFKQSADDEKRRAAWRAEGEWYNANAGQLDGIYDALVRLRDKMGRTLGYDGFTELGYYRMTRNSYSRADIERYREAVVRYIVPVAETIMRAQAQRTGLPYPLSFADAPLEFRTGNAKPKGGPDDVMAAGKRFYTELSPETAEFFDFMLENGLFDVLSRKGKAGGGFCTDIPDYDSPFIFANFNGTKGDVEVITHEAGHAFASYVARDIFPMENKSPTLESCEIHSMSMEFFAWPWAEEFFGGDADKFRYAHLADALTFLPYGTMVDHFQHIMYDKPSMTPGERHDVWRGLLRVYMPWMKRDDLPFYGEGKGWQRQAHIYENPFYYIDYCLAQSAALQFWALMQTNRRDAWEKYRALVHFAGTKTFTELVTGAGLISPLESESLAFIASAAQRWLGDAKAEL